MAQVLTDGGIHAAEITLRTDAAVAAIEKMRLACPNMLIGAGTVLTVEQMYSAIAAGASFIISPGFNPRTVKAALKDNKIVKLQMENELLRNFLSELGRR